MSGVYTTAPGLSPLSKDQGTSNIFDVDEHYLQYIDNKRQCRKEGITKYYAEKDFSTSTADAVVGFLAERLCTEFPKSFGLENELFSNLQTGDSFSIRDIHQSKTDYHSPFDGICSQLQEDVAVIQLKDETDWLSAIHLCSPNHWDPLTKVGRPFNEVHSPVPEFSRTVKNYHVMMKMIVDKGPFTRFAWGISTDARLNHHPTPPSTHHEDEWRGRKLGHDGTEFYVRAERQNLIGLPAVNAFIFTIRTYFYEVALLTMEEKSALRTAVNSMTSATLEYKGMTLLKEPLMKMLL